MPPAPRVLSHDEMIGRLSWPDAVEALRRGHTLPRAEIRDVFLGPPTGTKMSRSAHIPGLGYGAKTFTVFDANAARGLPTVQGAMQVFDNATGSLRAIVDSLLVTEIKTAADSVLGASLLARPESQHLLVVVREPSRPALSAPIRPSCRASAVSRSGRGGPSRRRTLSRG